MVCKNVLCLRTEKKGLCKRKALDLCKMVQVHLERFSTNKNVFSLRKRRIFQLMQDNLEKKSFCLRKKLAFSTHVKPTDKEKLFLNTAKLQLPTAPKLTCSHKFHPRNPTVSLQQNNPFSKLCNLASARQSPFRTDSNPHRRYPETLRFSVPPVT